MSSSTNPLLTSLIPGGNSTGSTISMPYGPAGGVPTSSGQNPLMPQVSSGTSSTAQPYANYNFAANASPYTSPTTAPLPVGNVNTGNNPNNAPVNAVASGLGDPSTNQGQHQLWDQLSKTYGSGMATALENFLNQGAGFNQTAINQLLASLQPQFNQNSANLNQQFSSTGNRFSSGAEIGQAALMSGEALDVGQIESQMYEQSVNDYINVLTGTASTDASRIQAAASSTAGQIGSLVGDAAGAFVDVAGLGLL